LTVRLWPRSLRARLILWYTAALGALLLVLGAVALFLLDRGLRRTADASLESLARTVAESSRAPTRDGELSDALAALLGPGLAERFFQLLDPLGRPDPRLAPSGRLTLPLDAETLRNAQRGRPTFQTVRLSGAAAPIRVLTTPVMDHGRLVQLVQVAMSLEVIEAARARFILVLAGLLPVALAAAAAGGWFLAGRALAPVDAMVETARRIGAENLSRRLASDAAHDELGRLAAVLNDMLDRLERSFTAARQFSADAAHELRTPLTILRGELEVALAAAPSDAGYRRALESCLEEVGRLSSLVEDLLFLARADAGAVVPPSEPVDLAAVVSDAAPALEALAARAGVHLTLEPAAAPARGSAPLLFRVVFNLVENAIKHTRAGARVTIATRTDDGAAVLEVRDDGPGIAPEDRERIFERFYRADPARERGGAGLGLPLTRAIVVLHGGRITVTGGPGAGSCFRVILPRATV
jgi:heavy metal sensor kinase